MVVRSGSRVEEAFRSWSISRDAGPGGTALGARRAAVIPFLVAGDPSLAATAEALVALSQAGARVLEIGIPFSDPIADGPIISEAMRRAIEQGVTPRTVFEMVARERSRVESAIVFMVSVSIVERIGRERFVREAADSGADGLIVPDLDLDDAEPLRELCRSRGMALPMLVAPATSPQRQRRIVEACDGFIYLLARAGVTGTIPNSNGRETSPSMTTPKSNAAGEGTAPAASTPEAGAEAELGRRVASLRAMSSLPIACGFGISRREQVAAVTRHADAVIVGSAFVRAMEGAKSPEAAARELLKQ